MNHQSNTESKYLYSESLASRLTMTAQFIQKNKRFYNKFMLSAMIMISPIALAAPVDMTYDDWQVVCDNTLTCRMAGYQANLNSAFPASILLTRQAGNSANIDGKIKLGGDKKGSNKALMELGDRHRASLFINGKDLGETKSSSIGAGYTDLNAAQVKALLEALTQSSKIELVVRNTRWQVSDKGATAAMLKADETQGRIGTPSALINPSSTSSNNVLAAKAAPQIRLVIPNQKTNSNSSKKFSMKSSQLAQVLQSTIKNTANDCPNLSDKTPWKINRLNNTQLLAQHNCWISAYNAGNGMWVMNDSKPYNPKLVTVDATSYDDNGTIKSLQKGRGLGDCMTKSEWVWTGKSFSKSHEASTGLCRMVAAGGAWELPTYVSEVKR